MRKAITKRRKPTKVKIPESSWRGTSEEKKNPTRPIAARRQPTTLR
jgi:hypothetical protein